MFPSLLVLVQFPSWRGTMQHLDGPSQPPPSEQTLVKTAQRASVKLMEQSKANPFQGNAD